MNHFLTHTYNSNKYKYLSLHRVKTMLPGHPTYKNMLGTATD